MMTFPVIFSQSQTLLAELQCSPLSLIQGKASLEGESAEDMDG